MNETTRSEPVVHAVGSLLDREVRPLAVERDLVLRELTNTTNQTWAGKRKRWASLVRAQDAEIARLTHALAQSWKLAEDRLQQIQADRAQALRWRAQLDHATEDGSAGKGTGRHIAEFVLDPP